MCGGGRKEETDTWQTHPFLQMTCQTYTVLKAEKGKKGEKKKRKKFSKQSISAAQNIFLEWRRQVQRVKSCLRSRGRRGVRSSKAFPFSIFFLLLISNLHTRTPHLPDVVAALARVFLSYLLICRNAPSENCFKGKNTILSAFFCHFFPAFLFYAFLVAISPFDQHFWQIFFFKFYVK